MASQDEKQTADAPKRLEVKPVQLGGESLVDRLLPHMKKILIGTGVVALILTVVFGVRWFRERKRAGETEKLAKVVEVGEKPVRPAGAEPDPKQPSYADPKERANALLDALTKHGATAGGPSYRASLLVQAGKLDDAITEYRKDERAKGLDGVLAREGLGLALEMKAEQEKDAAARQKGLEAALEVFSRMQPDENGPRRAYALYHQGRLLGVLGKRDEAKAALEKAKELGKGSDIADLVEERLASLGAS